MDSAVSSLKAIVTSRNQEHGSKNMIQHKTEQGASSQRFNPVLGTRTRYLNSKDETGFAGGGDSAGPLSDESPTHRPIDIRVAQVKVAESSNYQGTNSTDGNDANDVSVPIYTDLNQ